MTWFFAHTAVVVAGLAVVACPFVISRKGLLPSLLTAVALGIAAAVLVTVARGNV